MDLVIVTEQGTVKRVALDQFRKQSRAGGGVIAIGVAEGDRVKAATCAGPDQDVIIVTERGQAIRFAGSEARAMGRTAKGVKGLTLKQGDKVSAVLVAS